MTETLYDFVANESVLYMAHLEAENHLADIDAMLRQNCIDDVVGYLKGVIREETNKMIGTATQTTNGTYKSRNIFFGAWNIDRCPENYREYMLQEYRHASFPANVFGEIVAHSCTIKEFSHLYETATEMIRQDWIDFLVWQEVTKGLRHRLDTIGDEGGSEKKKVAGGATISKRGPKARPFRELVLVDNVDEVMAEIHNLISKAKCGLNGKKGKAVGIILRVAVDEGIISAPTFQEIFNEFNQYSIGSQQAITPYLRNPAKSIYNMAEAEGAKKRFEQIRQ